MDRIRPLAQDQLSEDVRGLLMATRGPVVALEGGEPGTEAPPRGPLNILLVMAHQPQLVDPFLGWASALALHGVLPRRDHELLALRTAANCASDFEWGHHVVYGRAVGLEDDDFARIVVGPEAPGWDDHEAALLRAADELHGSSTVGDRTWATLVSRYPPAALVEMTLVVGQYTMLSMLANAAGVPLEAGLEPLPTHRGSGH